MNAPKIDLSKTLTLYGRQTILELLLENNVTFQKIHLAESNKVEGKLKEILHIANKKAISIEYHSKLELSRISKNSKQDQGIAADILCPHWDYYQNITIDKLQYGKLIALDGVTNPQNLGMIIRSIAAGNCDGLLYSKLGNASLNPLVVKASAGTIFKTPIYRCHHLKDSLIDLKQQGFQIASLDSHATQNLFELPSKKPTIFILGNESTGVSKEIENLCDCQVKIPMNRQVESLNVAITAALICYSNHLAPPIA